MANPGNHRAAGESKKNSSSCGKKTDKIRQAGKAGGLSVTESSRNEQASKGKPWNGVVRGDGRFGGREEAGERGKVLGRR